MADKKQVSNKKIDWYPRDDPDKKKPSEKPSFSRPRNYDFSSVAWDFKDFWSQKEPMNEIKYATTTKKK